MDVTRRKFLAVGGGSAGLAAFLAACGGDSGTTMTTDSTGSGAEVSETARFGKGNVGILNHALTLEYLEAKFYEEGKRRVKADGQLMSLIDLLATDEQQHVEALAAAGGIVQVEARHAAAIRLQNGAEPSPNAFDPPLDEKQVLKAVEPLLA